MKKIMCFFIIMSLQRKKRKSQTSAMQHCSPQQAVTHSKQEQHNSLPQAVSQDRPEDGTAALVRLFAESISASRIPLPEPTVFNGDPLRFNDWKVSFQTLVDWKNIPAHEKVFYLRKYVGGPAKKAIEIYAIEHGVY